MLSHNLELQVIPVRPPQTFLGLNVNIMENRLNSRLNSRLNVILTSSSVPQTS